MRLLRPSDAPALAATYVRNRVYLSRWNPTRPEEYYTEAGQAADVASRLAAREAGQGHPFGVFEDNIPVGRRNLAKIVHGSFRSAVLSYFADNRHAGRGLSSAAAKVVEDEARGELGCPASKRAHCRRMLVHIGCC